MSREVCVRVRQSIGNGLGRSGRGLFAVLPLLAVACGGSGGLSGLGGGGGGPAAEARALMDQGRLDEALAALEGAPSEPEVIFVQGQVWAKKAELAPPPEPEEEGAPPPQFKLEERNALAFFETLTAAVPDHAGAHLAIAELLAPHALAKLEAPARRGPAPPADPTLPDHSAQRIVREIEAAIAADPGLAPVNALIEFCTAAEDLDCAERGYRMLPERIPESFEPHRRLADFLLEHREDPDAAIQQYDLALVWAPDDAPEDAEMRAKVAGIYLDRAEEQIGQRRWALADQALKSARKYIRDRAEPAAARATALESTLAQQSGRRY